ncbi:hypothetical protein [Gramella sp. AN32]|uniref:Outer membrane protein beta-barrel domain-containing protein n=1 Tax=Christiangramia antarctica TaxID=2058158 RepID=A0ABW5X334_9FLAO|nr:hypothetical protein [Gramella sp. AN32]MCM4157682.1 hypothetical protein [Gramella sp. AN32]
MKKHILLLVFTFSAFFNCYSQNEWRLELNAGANVGDYLNDTGISAGADVSYLIPITTKISIGPTTGFSRLFLNSSDDFNFLPIAASGRISLNNNIFIGTDLGYSIIWIDGWDGGFYYRPKIGYKFNKFNLIGSYSTIDQNPETFSFAKLGVEFRL